MQIIVSQQNHLMESLQELRTDFQEHQKKQKMMANDAKYNTNNVGLRIRPKVRSSPLEGIRSVKSRAAGKSIVLGSPCVLTFARNTVSRLSGKKNTGIGADDSINYSFVSNLIIADKEA